jgi:hypothetical protein
MKKYELLDNLDNNIIPIDTYYNKAVIAVQECAKLDEAKEWTDKMSALAYYHKQAGDKTLENYAIRIRHRGQRRMGELLKQFDGRGLHTEGNQYTGQNGKKEDDLHSPNSLNNAATSVGLSEWQTKESIRFANIPEDKFEEIIESDNIPTKSEIAELGTKKREIKVDKSYKAVGFVSDLRQFIKSCNEDDPIFLLSVMDEKQKKETLEMIKKVENWFDTFVINCQEQ